MAIARVPTILLLAALVLPVAGATARAAPRAVGATKEAGDPAKSPSSPEAKRARYENLELFQKVLHYVENNYVESVDNKDLIYGAIKGMLETLDPHSNFLPPEIFREMKVDTSGKFGGVGIEVSARDGVLTVAAPIDDTPAWRAGLKPNDRIVRIDGESTKGMSVTEAVTKMRGKKGSEISVTIFRDGFKAPKEVRLVRDTIKVQSVKSEALEPGFGYVRLANFNESAAPDIKSAIAKLEKAGGGKLQGLVLDLRSNPGGLLDQAVEVSSLFVDEGVIVSTRGRNRDDQKIRHARKGAARKDFPVVVLVNSSTASAAEIVAGALQDHHRAIVMGQSTFGKGSVQQVIELGPDLGLKLTIERYYTPSGRSIQEKGVVPDVALDEYDPKLLAEARRTGATFRERDLKGHMVNTEAGEETEPSDSSSTGTKGGKREDYRTEELVSNPTPRKAGDPAVADELTPGRFAPKEDFQVREALGYLRSYEVFRKLALKNEPAPPVALGTGVEKKGPKTADATVGSEAPVPVVR